jgi:hypothetical protein
MAQAKIQSLTEANPSTWISKRDGATMYAFDAVLDDGTTGQVSSKSPDRWKVGDDVEYSSQSNFHGTKLTFSKPGYSGGSSRSYSDDDTKGIIASWAVGIAMQVADSHAGNYEDQVMQFARLALQARARIKPEVQP